MIGRRVIHISSVHRSSDTRIYHKECTTLAAAGYDVSFIVPHDGSVPEGVVRIVPVARPSSRPERMTKTLWRCWRIAAGSTADLYHLHDPELLPVGLALKLRGRAVIYDVHEDVPRQVLGKYWLSPLLRRVVSVVMEILEWVAGRLVDGVVAATPDIARRFPPSKTVTVQNFPMPQELVAPSAQPYAARPAEIVYVGGLMTSRGLTEMIAATAILARSVPDLALVLVGPFSPPWLETEARRVPGWERVRYLGWQSRQGVAAALGQARVGLAVLHPAPNYLTSYPVKVFEYMAAGIPVVVSDFDLWRRIVDAAGCGLLVDPRNPEAIAAAVGWLLEHRAEAEEMGERGRRAVAEGYNWGNESTKLLRLYERLLRQDIRRPASQSREIGATAGSAARDSTRPTGWKGGCSD